ncbi:hypothetical protein [Sagittula sp. S175]|uniref:hypothetical protein n=1 Tax=Sagittula sp. S175 TaxID=3415129 RepID=UPI003C7ED209
MLGTVTGRVMALLIGLAGLWAAWFFFGFITDLMRADWGADYFGAALRGELSRRIPVAFIPLFVVLALTWALRPVWKR